MINVQIERGPTENSNIALRKFTKRVQDAGILNRVRKLRDYVRVSSKNRRKAHTIEKLVRKTELEKNIKLGKIRPVNSRGR